MSCVPNNLFLKLIAGTECSKMITIVDKINCKSNQLFSCFIQARSPKPCCLLLLENDLSQFSLNQEKNLEIINIFANLKVDSINFDAIESIFDKKVCNFFLFIDSLSPLFLTQTIKFTANFILNLSKKCTQMILKANGDLLLSHQLECIKEISQTLIELDSTQSSDCLRAIITHKRHNNKLGIDLIKVENMFTISSQLNVLIRKDIKDKPLSIEDESESLINLLPFNLRLTEDEKKLKDQLILPHCRQNESSKIFYVPGQEDDVDEEDPDEDLLI